MLQDAKESRMTRAPEHRCDRCGDAVARGLFLAKIAKCKNEYRPVTRRTISVAS